MKDSSFNHNSDLVMVNAYDNPVSAHMAKNELEAEGIEAFIFDENTVALNPLWTVTVGWIKLMTRRSDLVTAQEILRSLNHLPTVHNGEPLKCPSCGSIDITAHLHSVRGVKAVFAFIVALFTLTYPIFTNEVNQCNKCGTEFKPPN